MGERKIALDFRSLPEGMRQCGKCREIKHMSEFYKDRRRASQVSSKCKVCTGIYLKERRRNPEIDHLSARRKWTETNRERVREVNRIWTAANRQRRNLQEANRRARKRELPDNFDSNDLDELLYIFDGKCAISGEEFEHLDHFIPLATGYGGTIVGNMIPLCARLNLSKRDQNPLEWRNTLTDFEKERFDFVLEFLSAENRVSVEEYKEYVNSCFINEK